MDEPKLPAGYESKIKEVARDRHRSVQLQIRALRRQLDLISTFTYGSYTSGRSDWQARWRDSPGRRILMYAPVDAAGSFYQWAEAINLYTNYAARLVCFYPHKHGYELDLLMPFPDLDNRYAGEELLAEADVFHIKDEPGFFLGTNHLPQDFFSQWRKPTIFTAHGGYMRKLKDDPQYRTFVRSFDARIAMTPDLNYEWFDGVYIPHTIDVQRYEFAWKDGKVIGHSPTRSEDPAKKGTHFLTQALEEMRSRPARLIEHWDVDIIVGVAHDECMARKKKTTLFFDQAGQHTEEAFGINEVIGWYGNSAIEAMAMGIPTIAHLSDEAVEGARRGGAARIGDCPIIRVERSTEAVLEAIEDFVSASAKDRKNLAEASRHWAEQFHSYSPVAQSLAAVYSELLGE